MLFNKFTLFWSVFPGKSPFQVLGSGQKQSLPIALSYLVYSNTQICHLMNFLKSCYETLHIVVNSQVAQLALHMFSHQKFGMDIYTDLSQSEMNIRFRVVCHFAEEYFVLSLLCKSPAGTFCFRFIAVFQHVIRSLWNHEPSRTVH